MPTSLDANQAIQGAYRDAEEALAVVDTSALVPEQYDDLQLTYVAAGNGVGEIETVEYRQGGPAGILIATLTLGYDGSNRLISVTRT